MKDREPRRHRGLSDDARGGLITFLIEIGIVVVLAFVALVLAAVILAMV